MRKSLKMGPVRFNLSKSGIGISAGIKGLKLGMDSRGKSYVAGGRHGLYFNESLSSNLNSNSVDTFSVKQSLEHNVESTDKYDHHLTLKNIELGKFELNSTYRYIFTFWFSLGFFIFSAIGNIPELSFIFFLIFIINLPTKYIRKYQAKRYIQKMENVIIENKHNEFLNLIEQLNNKSKKDKSLKSYIYSIIYSKLIPNIIEDMIIDDSEKALISQIKNNLPKETWESINIVYINNLLSIFIDDKYLDESEEHFLKTCLNIFDIPKSDQTKYYHIIEQYSSIRKIATSPLKSISPSMNNIKESDKCYYENKVRILKSKIIKSFTQNGIKNKFRQLSLDKEGNFFITANTIQLVTTGHSTIKIESILENNYLEEEDGIIELIIFNKTKPIYLSTPNIIETFTVLNKVIGQKLS
ncbi:MAG: DUF4236 domain-containing protein [Spirochaetia bacterium]|nr:DUF4236 domain-containing protein [Spirochaetia bacterium]